MVSTFAMDERSRNQEGFLSTDARSASVDKKRKTTANAAGVSAQGHDESAIVQGMKHIFRRVEMRA